LAIASVGSTLNFVFGGLLIIAFCKEEGRRRRCGNGGKAGAVLRRLLQTACGNHRKEVAEGHLYRFPQLWPFPQRFAPRGFPLVQRFLFQKKKAPGCPLEPKTRVINRLCSGANQ
jgi:hypothetical protein